MRPFLLVVLRRLLAILPSMPAFAFDASLDSPASSPPRLQQQLQSAEVSVTTQHDDHQQPPTDISPTGDPHSLSACSQHSDDTDQDVETAERPSPPTSSCCEFFALVCCLLELSSTVHGDQLESASCVITAAQDGGVEDTTDTDDEPDKSPSSSSSSFLCRRLALAPLSMRLMQALGKYGSCKCCYRRGSRRSCEHGRSGRRGCLCSDWLRGADEQRLVGVLRVTTAVLRHTRRLRRSNTGLAFVRQLFAMLFALPSPQQRHLPACQSNEARAAGFHLLGELAAACQRNFATLLSLLTELIDQQQQRQQQQQAVESTTAATSSGGDEKQRASPAVGGCTWDYWPHDERRASCGYVGLTNLGATCYMASCVQHLFMIPEARARILEARVDATDNKHAGTLYELQQMFAYIMESKRRSYNPRSFCRVYTMQRRTLNTGEQKDMAEFFTDLLSKLEEMTRPLQQLVKQLFCGEISNNVVSLDCEHVSRTSEQFHTVRCQVADMRSLYDSLNELTVRDTLDGDNMYTCSQCGRKVRAEKRACFKKLPYILCFNTMRYKFNMETLMREKVNTLFSFPLRLNMADYLEHNLMTSGRRRSDSGTGGRQSNTTAAGSDADSDASIYELIGVTVHTGTADGGHYYSFIRDRTSAVEQQQQRWLLFNDAEVRPFDTRQLGGECFGGEITSKTYDSITDKFLDFSFEKTNSAYMLFYERCVNTDDVCPQQQQQQQQQQMSPASAVAECSQSASGVQHKSRACLRRLHVPHIQLSSSLQQKVWADNRQFVLDQFLFDHSMFSFMWHVCGSIPRELCPSAAVLLSSARVSTAFFLEIFIRAKEKPTMVQWVELLTKQFNTSQAACEWFLDHMTTDCRWPVRILVKCDNQIVRQMFQRLCIHVIQKLRPTHSRYYQCGSVSESGSCGGGVAGSAPRDTHAGRCVRRACCDCWCGDCARGSPCPATTTTTTAHKHPRRHSPATFERRLAQSPQARHDNDNEETAECSEEPLSDAGDDNDEQLDVGHSHARPADHSSHDAAATGNVSCVALFVKRLVSLTDRIHRSHVRNLTEYFAFLYEFGRMGAAEVNLLLSINCITAVVHFYLSQTPDNGDETSDMDDDEDDEDAECGGVRCVAASGGATSAVAGASSKLRPASLAKMLQLVTLLVENSRTADGLRLTLSHSDLTAVAGGKGFPFLCRQIRDGLNVRATCHLVLALCNYNEPLATLLVAILFQGVVKYPESCQSFFPLLSLLIESDTIDSSSSSSSSSACSPAHPPLSPPQSSTSSSALLDEADSVGSVTSVAPPRGHGLPCFTQLILAHVCRVCRLCPLPTLEWLAGHVINSRLTHSWCVQHLDDWCQHYLIAHAQYRVRLAASCLLVNLVPCSQFRHMFLQRQRSVADITLSADSLAILHQVYLYLLGLLRPARAYADVATHGTMKLVQYFQLLQYCVVSRAEKLMFTPYTSDLWALLHPKLSEPSVAILHNKQALFMFWCSVCIDCTQNVQQVVANQDIVKNIAFNYILADHDDEQVVLYNRGALPAYYGLLRLCCVQSRAFARQLAAHQNLQWALKNITPFPSQYNVVVDELFKLVAVLATVHADSTEQELRDIAAFKRQTLQMYMQVLDGRCGWSSLITCLKLLASQQSEQLLAVYSGALPLLTDAVGCVHAGYHDSASSGGSGGGHVAAELLQLVHLTCQLLRSCKLVRDSKEMRHTLASWKNCAELARKLATLLNSFTPPHLRVACIDTLKEMVVMLPLDCLPVLTSMMLHAHDTPALAVTGPYFPAAVVACGGATTGGACQPRLQLNMNIPPTLQQNLSSFDRDDGLHQQLLDYFLPYHVLADLMCRVAVNSGRLSGQLLALSCRLALEAVPLQLAHFAKLWIDVHSTKSMGTHWARLLSCDALPLYMERVLSTTRLSLNNSVINKFFTIFLPKVCGVLREDGPVLSQLPVMCQHVSRHLATLIQPPPPPAAVSSALAADLRALILVAQVAAPSTLAALRSALMTSLVAASDVTTDKVADDCGVFVASGGGENDADTHSSVERPSTGASCAAADQANTRPSSVAGRESPAEFVPDATTSEGAEQRSSSSQLNAPVSVNASNCTTERLSEDDEDNMMVEMEVDGEGGVDTAGHNEHVEGDPVEDRAAAGPSSGDRLTSSSTAVPPVSVGHILQQSPSSSASSSYSTGEWRATLARLVVQLLAILRQHDE